MEKSVVIEEFTSDWALQLGSPYQNENCTFRHKINIF